MTVQISLKWQRTKGGQKGFQLGILRGIRDG